MPNPTEILHGLVYGTHPLPPPHPQRLSFPRRDDQIEYLASYVLDLADDAGLFLTDDEWRHLLFKIASWCTRRAALFMWIDDEVDDIWPAIEFVLRIKRDWITNRAGIGFCLRRFDQHVCDSYAQARKTYPNPRKVAEVNADGFYLVELLNGAHVYEEGKQLEHCMAKSINIELQQKLSAFDAFEALTYAVKIRTGELRIFSVRDPQHAPLITIAYSPKTKTIVEISYDRRTRLLCEALRVLTTIAPTKHVHPSISPHIKRYVLRR